MFSYTKGLQEFVKADGSVPILVKFCKHLSCLLSGERERERTRRKRSKDEIHPRNQYGVSTYRLIDGQAVVPEPFSEFGKIQ